MKERPGNKINCVLCEEKEINKQKSIKRTSSTNWEKLTPAVVYFFQAAVLFCIKNAEFWPLLTNLGDLSQCIFLGLNNVAV